jgi:hypothetical protein
MMIEPPERLRMEEEVHDCCPIQSAVKPSGDDRIVEWFEFEIVVE